MSYVLLTFLGDGEKEGPDFATLIGTEVVAAAGLTWAIEGAGGEGAATVEEYSGADDIEVAFVLAIPSSLFP